MIELAKAFFLCGLLSFGGGYAMIPLVHRELIAGRGWLTVEAFTEMIAVAEMTPGPIAVNTATFVGYRVGGVLGSLLSTAAVLTVPALISGAFAYFLARFGRMRSVSNILCGLRPAACALLATAALTVAKGTTYDIKSILIGAGAALALWRRVNPLLVIAGSALLGLLLF